MSHKKSKYIALSNAEIAEERILLPGRRPCSCEASRHDLINNCVECGRIVCMQEGSGPCFTCNAMVCTDKEKEIIMKENKASFKLLQKLMGESNAAIAPVSTKSNEKFQSAIEHKNKLLEYDRAIEQRTKVIDDENDFFQTNSQWLDSREKKILKKKQDEVYELMHNRQKQVVTFDFAGRKIVEENPEIKIDIDELLKPDTSIFECTDFSNLGMPLTVHPEFIEDEMDEHQRYYSAMGRGGSEADRRVHIRIQDRELQEMCDAGHCISLQQPYASLLVAGLKMHEGRTWYTSYRGRLWIHAAGKTVLKQEIADVESMFRENCGVQNLPKSYPRSCLLGCVDLMDCIPQDEYRIQYPDGLSASPYVFICENAQELIVKIPMKGQHKLYKLDSNIHQAAKKTLKKVS